MRNNLSILRAAVVATVVLAVVCCGLYPLTVYALAQLAFPTQANGSLIRDDSGTVRGSALLGQHFTGAGYFHPRPSAAGAGYDALQSGGSNLGPTSQTLRNRIQTHLAAYRQENGLNETDAVPADAVTASGSGLDPHISPENARLQIERIAQDRHLTRVTVADLVENSIEPPQCRVLGEPRLNVLRLNLRLDRLPPSGQKE